MILEAKGLQFRSTKDDSLTYETPNGLIKVTPKKRISVKLVNTVKTMEKGVSTRGRTTINTRKNIPEISQDSRSGSPVPYAHGDKDLEPACKVS